MIKIDDKSKCTGCHACFQICPTKCISMVNDGEGFFYPYIDVTKCVNCGLCEKYCHIYANRSGAGGDDNINKILVAVNPNEKERMIGSSGGVFSIIAKYVLGKGGVVFGASFNNGFKVEHICVNNEKDLWKICGSKYVQSKIGNTFYEAKQLLLKGKMVLFSGTPCQIGALKIYLGQEFDNLLTQDFICHGVPSPQLWGDYVLFRERKAKSVTDSISFRNKRFGWAQYSVSFEFKNGKRYLQKHQYDPYMNLFLSNLSLRPSCYSCQFKGTKKESDFTLGDFWGFGTRLNNNDIKKGVSLLFINKENIHTKEIEKIVDIKNISLDENFLKQTNPSFYNSVAIPRQRKTFFSNYSRSLKLFRKNYILKKIAAFMKRCLSSIKKEFF